MKARVVRRKGAIVSVVLLALMIVVSPVLLQAAGLWVTAANMNDVRYEHTLTLLEDGRVLAAGGYIGSGATANADLYYPEHDQWFPTTLPMTYARRGHTATLLPRNVYGYRDVLIAGGVHEAGTLAMSYTDVFDTLGGSFLPVGNMWNGRAYHTATLLLDGTVLVAGGLDFTLTEPIRQAELYDLNGSWTVTGMMTGERAHHTATLLPSGRVMVIGGLSKAGEYYLGSEIYDPTTKTWSAVPAMMTNGRAWHSATLLQNGKLLVAGGKGSGGAVLNTAELYDPATGTWSSAGTMAQARMQHSAVLLDDGRVLVAGGSSADALSTAVASAEIYDPATNSWTATSAMAMARARHGAVLLQGGTRDGWVFVAGGGDSGGALASAELFRDQPAPADADGDGVPDVNDNCVNTPNADQADTNSDGEGDACDLPGLHVDGIALTVKFVKTYTFGAQVTVVDKDGLGVSKVLVIAEWTLGDGTKLTQQATTGRTGVATFRNAKDGEGTYTICIQEVSKAGYEYWPTENVQECASQIVP